MEIKHRRDIWRLMSCPILNYKSGQLNKATGPAVEVGVAEGSFSEELLRMPVNFPKVYMVDRWKRMDIRGDSANSQTWHDENKERAIARVKKFGDRACVLQGESVEEAKGFADGVLALVYLDADHSYEGVCRDIEAWFPKIMKDGIFAFHDYLNMAYGVHKAVNDFGRKHGIQIHTIPEHRSEDAGAWFIC